MPNLTGHSIGRYHVLEQLGEGGMATVYTAYDTRLERNVALKVLRTDQFIPAELETVLQRFEREAKSLAKISHPNIVNILDFGEYEGKPFLVMEYLPGGTLKQRMGQAIPWQEAFRILLPVARGLAYAHQHDIIHRDVKPANIMMDEFNEPILTDFGIAKLLAGTEGHTLTGSGVGIGTPEYMAPEQGTGASAIDARADIYSLGIVLYEMVVGRKPYIAETPMAVVLKQITDPLPRPRDFVPDLPESVEHIIFKALAKQPEDRYEDMNALIAAMESLLEKAPTAEIQAVPAPAPSKQEKEKAAPRTKPSGKVIKTVVGTLVVIALIVLGIMVAPSIGSYLSPAPTNTPTPTATITATPTATQTNTPSPTPDPRIFNFVNQHLYLYIDQSTTWHEARDTCASQGGYLVTIQDAGENGFVYQLLPDGISWLGATDEAEEGTWVWVSGEPWEYTNWAPGEPNNADKGGEHYLSISYPEKSPLWNDLPLGELPFVCEWEPTQNATAIPISDRGADFVQPILTYIKSEPPTFEDNFSTGKREWGTDSYWSSVTRMRQDGALQVTKNGEQNLTFPTNGLLKATDFAVAFDFFPDKSQADAITGRFGLIFRSSQKAETYYNFNLSYSKHAAVDSWQFFETDGTTARTTEINPVKLNNGYNHILIIVQQENLAIFVNDQFLHLGSGLTFWGDEIFFISSGPGGSSAKLDNVQFWDLDNMEFASTAIDPSPVWATDSIEPIYAYINSQPATFEDNFLAPKYEWGNSSEGIPVHSLIQNGFLFLGDRIDTDYAGDLYSPDYKVPGVSFPTTGLFDASDFALQFNFAFNDLDTTSFQFRSTVAHDTGYQASFSRDGSWNLIQFPDGTFISEGNESFVKCTAPKNQQAAESPGGYYASSPGYCKWLFIAKGNKLFIVLNDEMIYEGDDLNSSGRTNTLSIFSSYDGARGRFDDFKFWNLDGVDF